MGEVDAVTEYLSVHDLPWASIIYVVEVPVVRGLENYAALRR